MLPVTVRNLIARMVSTIQPSPENTSIEEFRVSRYAELFTVNSLAKKYPQVTGGEYRVASMTPGQTALQLGLSASFSATACAIAFQNSDVASSIAGGKRCYLDYIRFLVTTAPTSATSLLAATVVDSKDRTPTTISNGTGNIGPGTAATATVYRSPVVDPNMDNAQPVIVGVPYFPFSTTAGAPPAIPAAGGNARTVVGNLPLRGQIPVVQDEYLIDFGSNDAVPSGGLVTAAPAGASRIVAAHPGIVIGPAQWFLLYLWGPSNVTAGIAFSGLDMGWWER